MLIFITVSYLVRLLMTHFPRSSCVFLINCLLVHLFYTQIHYVTSSLCFACLFWSVGQSVCIHIDLNHARFHLQGGLRPIFLVDPVCTRVCLSGQHQSQGALSNWAKGQNYWPLALLFWTKKWQCVIALIDQIRATDLIPCSSGC